MTQTSRKWYGRSVCRIYNADTARRDGGNPVGGYDVIIQKFTLADLLDMDIDLRDSGPILAAMAENGKGYCYEVSAHDGARSEYVPSYAAAREWAESQYC